MEPIRFAGTVRFWDPEKGGGLAVVDIPALQAQALGGLKQQRVQGAVAGVAFISNVMPAGRGLLALSVNKAMMKAAGIGVGDTPSFEITLVSRD
ncbi:MAG: DUF1905 domain-containing protein [Candidatus Limnocylindrales bacterium]